MEKMLGKKRHIAVFVLPALLIFVVFSIIPLITSGLYSLFEYDGIGTMKFIGFDNYIRMFTGDRYFPKAVVNSLILVGASLFIQLPISLGLAMLLSKGVKGEKFFRTIYFLPVVISSMVIGQLWIKIFHSEYGLLNLLISTVTGETFDYSWLSNPRTAFLSTVVPAVWQYIGYHMLIFYAGIKSIPKDYYEAAMIDGATRWQTNLKITIPLLAPVIKTCSIFAITGSLRAFDLIYVMTGGGPNHASDVPATLMYNNLFRRGLYGFGSAQAFFIVIECLAFSYIVTKLFKKAEENVSAL
ncbi:MULTISPECIES: carbohydrate ABC transporter permease [Proteiniclasticum]|uniref:Raffinose/stachyose/melibiose transport system permease protein n=1 Tax=Proteiniclasticum ruminis TaxID=398199 RepID=A0A1G8QE10_9CLOT|nr:MULTISPECIES: sugar ABC transporter permease [Proteiniclasticum]SDJ02931.1 raffinose/stachyose/melibiose transport system permease protein [Proteiniclasticum ruminis]